VIFGEGFPALVATEALESVPVPSKPLAGGTAVMTGHAPFSSVFSNRRMSLKELE
jgi:hypothetical protein